MDVKQYDKSHAKCIVCLLYVNHYFLYQIQCITLLLSLCGVVTLTSALKSWELPEDLVSAINSDLDLDWVDFKKNYNRTYENVREELERFDYISCTKNYLPKLYL